MSAAWFYQLDGFELGPVPTAEIDRLVRKGRILPGTLVRQVSSAPSQTLSSTERASATRTSWKTVTTPCRWADLGLRSWTSAPATSTRPESGACTPLRIFTSVLLPEPFSPTSA